VILYAAMILAVSSIPAKRLKPLELSGWDKAAHAIEYGVFSGLIGRALRAGGPGRLASSARSAAFLAFLLATCFGALDETYQGRTGRDPDPFDLAADGAGALIAQVIIVGREERKGSGT
jgi:VanZ family protein